LGKEIPIKGKTGCVKFRSHSVGASPGLIIFHSLSSNTVFFGIESSKLKSGRNTNVYGKCNSRIIVASHDKIFILVNIPFGF